MKFWKEFFGDQSPKVEEKSQFQDVLSRLVAAMDGTLVETVTPDNCMQSPTVHSIVTAISKRLSVTPIHVYRKSSSADGDIKEALPNHPVAQLLKKPNAWQTNIDFWQDAASTFVRHGRFYAYKSRGKTGPIRELIPIPSANVKPEQDEDNYRVSFRVIQKHGNREYAPEQIFHARGAARDFLTGDSPVMDVADTIALEIMAEQFGVTFFKNGALPLLVFNFQEGSAGFRTVEQEKQFIADFQKAFEGGNRHKGMLLPKGLDAPSAIEISHDKAQFLETRQYQRTVIAGAFGVPPNIIGDLSNSTYNNLEQESKNFTQNVILPVAQAFEAAMERDLLTDRDRAGGVCIRFNLDSLLRADFKSRQEGLKMQREMGVISANEWREHEGMNPRDGGDEYWEQGPSGQNMGNDDEIESDDSA
jgi:HK97 family phage portal protein